MGSALASPDAQESRSAARPASSDDSSRRSKRRIGIAWFFVATWAAVVWALGGDAFSLAETSKVMSPMIEWIFGDIDGRTKWKIFLTVRKSAHFVEYAILALLTFRAALLSAPRNQFATAAWVALFLVATLASADEARQSFSNARSGSPYDVLIDLTGGVVAVIGLLLITRRMRPSHIDTSSA
jgi:VanZ family protein